MQTETALKALVKEKYGEIADQSRENNAASCCGAGGCSTEIYNIMSDDYTKLPGYVEGADLGLGCGLPTEFAKIKEGDVVVDLGSGAGNDCFVARRSTGATGKVIGIVSCTRFDHICAIVNFNSISDHLLPISRGINIAKEHRVEVIIAITVIECFKKILGSVSWCPLQ